MVVLTRISEAFQPHQSVTSSALIFLLVSITPCLSQLLCFGLCALKLCLFDVKVFSEVINDKVVGAFFSWIEQCSVEEFKEVGKSVLVKFLTTGRQFIDQFRHFNAE